MRSAIKRLAPGNQNTIRTQRSHDYPDRISNGKHRYEIGAEIGRGGFAVVFQAFNVETGYFVAVKRFPLDAIDDESLGSIESEIELMKKLNHPNIVQYIDTIRTDSYLYIVLEYMENGSLANVIKKFGAFSESLTAIYTTQVLRGLKYLHEQGVLHRDIKGANILTTKDGHVKLADFGVAVKDTDVSSSDCDVVGTPYWMAPEIIAMSTPTVACDIWSVGCTVIELLTGKPPYFDCAPMAAMFRIVQDDYPPLPENSTQRLRDFLLECFQKEPTLRADAGKALSHPWLQASANQLFNSSDISESRGAVDISSAGGGSTMDSIIVNTIRTFKEGEKRNTGDELPSKGRKASASASLLHFTSPLTSSTTALPTYSNTVEQTSSSTESTLAAGEDRSEDWDDEGRLYSIEVELSGVDSNISPRRVDFSGTDAAQDDEEAEWAAPSDEVTIKKKVVISLDSIADISDFLVSNDPVHIPVVSTVLSPHSSMMNVLDLPTTTNVSISKWATNTPMIRESSTADINLLRFQEDPNDESDLNEAFDELEVISGSASVSPHSSSSNSPHTTHAMSSKLKIRMLNARVNVGLDDDKFDDILTTQFTDNDIGTKDIKDMHSYRSQRLLSLMEKFRSEITDEESLDSCKQILDILESNPEQKDQFISQYGVLPILEMLDNKYGSFDKNLIPGSKYVTRNRSRQTQTRVLRVINRFVDSNIRCQELLSLLGLIPVILCLFSDLRSVVDELLLETARFVHHISCSSNVTLLQMLIGAGGLPILVHMISLRSGADKSIVISSNQNELCFLNDPEVVAAPNEGMLLDAANMAPSDSSFESSEHADMTKEIVLMGVDCIANVFTVHSTRTRDFCRLLLKLSLLPSLSLAFKSIFQKYVSNLRILGNRNENQTPNLGSVSEVVVEEQAEEFVEVNVIEYAKISEFDQSEENKYLHIISGIFLNFSRSDSYVAEHMAKSGVLEVLNDSLKSSLNMAVVPFEVIDNLLKCIKNLSMEPSTLDALEEAGIIPTLVNLLDSFLSRKAENHVLPTMFNLCRVKRRREEQAAVSGFIPHLQRLIVENSHLKQLALRIICDFAQHNSAICRAELWKHNGVLFYINLLREKYWQTFALSALATWLANDGERVEQVLCVPENLGTLVAFFRTVSQQDISTLHKPLLDLMTKSQHLSRALSASGLFVSSLVKKLNDADPIVLMSLLKMVQLLHQNHASPRDLVLGYGLYSTVDKFCQAEKQVLVYEIATRLLKDFRSSTMT